MSLPPVPPSAEPELKATIWFTCPLCKTMVWDDKPYTIENGAEFICDMCGVHWEIALTPVHPLHFDDEVSEETEQDEPQPIEWMPPLSQRVN